MRFQGKNSRAAKLTVQKVLEIRRRYAEGDTQSLLSRVYQVSLVQIGRIVRGESWQQVPGVGNGRLSAEESERYMVQRAGNGQLRTEEEEIQASLEKVLRLQGLDREGKPLEPPPPPPMEELDPED